VFYEEAILELKVAGWLTDSCSKNLGWPVCGRKLRVHVTQPLIFFYVLREVLMFARLVLELSLSF
jgi:hypothetical protein